MGGSSSKPSPLATPIPQLARPDISQATNVSYSGAYLDQLQKQNEEVQAAAAKAAADAAATAQAALASASRWKFIGYGLVSLFGIALLVVVCILFYDLWARNNHAQTVFLPGLSKFTNFTEGMENQKCYGEPVDFSSGQFLTFDNVVNQAQSTGGGGGVSFAEMAKISGTTQNLEDAKTACGNNPKCKGIVYWNGKGLHPDWDGPINSNIERDYAPLKGYTPYAGDATITSIKSYDGPGGFTQAGSKLPAAGTLTFTPVKDCPPPAASASPPPAAPTVLATTTGPAPYSPSTSAPTTSTITPPASESSSPADRTVQAAAPPLAYQWLYGSGNMPGNVDASTSAIVPSAGAPLSAGGQGAYGIQWWMFIKDWNYGYGKEKPVLVRTDPTSAGIVNPKVVLHPTDNVLRISVSVFPTDSSGGVSEPVAANAPETAEDVFVCEVPNIPLQSWFAVSLTVFGRNLDVYINGMLVKSCFMTGVPKPAVGDIQITPNGGFSGNVCGLTTTNLMLNPSDALLFYSSDTTCHTQSATTGPVADTTGYSVKFGIFDTVGRQISQYTF
jgi:hypothetical protein